MKSCIACNEFRRMHVPVSKDFGKSVADFTYIECMRLLLYSWNTVTLNQEFSLTGK